MLAFFKVDHKSRRLLPQAQGNLRTNIAKICLCLSVLESTCSSFLQEKHMTAAMMAAWDIGGMYPVTVSCS